MQKKKKKKKMGKLRGTKGLASTSIVIYMHPVHLPSCTLE